MVTGTDLTRPRTIEGMTRPDPRHHYGQIISWVICWPWNLLWTFAVHNPFRYICQFALHEIQSTLDEISTGEFSEIARDMEERTPLATTPSASTATSPASPQPTLAKHAWTQPVEEEATSSLETVEEATFLTTVESVDQSAMETLEESSTWESLLKTDSSPQGVHAAAADRVDSSETYTPPDLPPTHEPDPWYYAPGGRAHDPRTPESN